jgi:hypothetical protein
MLMTDEHVLLGRALKAYAASQPHQRHYFERLIDDLEAMIRKGRTFQRDVTAR